MDMDMAYVHFATSSRRLAVNDAELTVLPSTRIEPLFRPPPPSLKHLSLPFQLMEVGIGLVDESPTEGTRMRTPIAMNIHDDDDDVCLCAHNCTFARTFHAVPLGVSVST
ncbi:glucosyltransferase [Anopheles sinensis]|uniref:Glucosyltransferase n=1 Tax=Anopheles sinensis TaxID=74873 RepID=A0A084WTA7_ANOSI|nr:glucosyltransferase [Anopheles sinensis]